MTPRTYAVGIDFGTTSARALAVDTATGEELATSVFAYRGGTGGVISRAGEPNLARQDPRDYLDAFESTLGEVVEQLGAQGLLGDGRVVGVGSATTGSTPMPLDAGGRPLALQERFREDIDAQAWLWKDHTAHAEAEEITETLRELALPYLDYVGRVYSSEWFWAKILRCSRVAPAVFAAAHTWCELADLVPAYATGAGTDLPRGACAAGHKAMFSQLWGGLPAREALAAVDPRLAAVRDRLYSTVRPASVPAGELAPALAARVGLPAVPVAVGTFDAHAGAVAAGVRPGRLVKIMGTSTCDCTVVDGDRPVPIPGVCGVVADSVLPGQIGIEAGQSAVGDLFDWGARVLAQPAGADDSAHAALSAAAAKVAPGASGLLALDWNNGNRTVLVDPLLGGLVVGQTLTTAPPEVYRALLEATAYGARVIVERLEQHGVPIDDVVVSGGIASSPLVMQIYADVLARPIRVARASNASAAGAAIYAATAAGAHPTTEQAQAAMGGVGTQVYTPQPAAMAVYERLFALYRRLHDAFAAGGRLGEVMKDLIALRTEVARI